MQIFRVDEIKLGPIDIIAEDRDHAARIFICALIDGLKRHPGADFSISEWTTKRLSRYDVLRDWPANSCAGAIWPLLEGDDWELIEYELTND